MSRGKELVKNTIIILIGRVSTQLLSFFMMPLYTHYINTSDYGYVDLIQSYIALIVPIIILRFDSAVFRFLIDAREDKKEKNNIITNTFLVFIVQIMIFVILFLVLSRFFKFEYLIYIILNVIFMAIAQVLMQMARGVGDNLGYAISSIIAGGITIITNLICIFKFKLGGESILISAILANASCAAFLFVKNKFYKNINKPQKQTMKKMLNYSIPMIPDGLSWWIVNASDRTLISIFLGNSMNGIYSVSCKFSNILSSFVQIFNMSWQENASLHINDKDNVEYFSKILNKTYKLFFFICILILYSIPFVFKFMIGETYQEAFKYIPILLLGNLYNCIAIVLGGIYIARKETKKVAQTTILGAILNLIIDLILIKFIGIWAAAISTMISYIFLAVYRYIDIKKSFNIIIDRKLYIISSILYVILTIIYSINNIFIDLIVFFIISIVLIWNYKDMIKSIFNRRGKQ